MRAHQPGPVAVVAIGAAVIALIAGLLLVALGAPHHSAESVGDNSAPPTLTAVATNSAGPITQRAGLPAGFTHDQNGATSAAIAYATASQRWLYFTDDQITAAVTAIATPSAAPRLSGDVVTDVRTARQRLGASPGRVWWLVRPLAWHVESYRADQATVAVWTVTVLSADKVAAPQCEWVTVTVDLVWVDGDWRVDAVRDTKGPTPVTGPSDQPWDAVPFDRALTGFTRMDGEPLS